MKDNTITVVRSIKLAAKRVSAAKGENKLEYALFAIFRVVSTRCKPCFYPLARMLLLPPCLPEGILDQSEVEACCFSRYWGGCANENKGANENEEESINVKNGNRLSRSPFPLPFPKVEDRRFNLRRSDSRATKL
jgi:hypothetical protein